MTTLNLARLRHFIAVAEARSLNQAARRLCLSQPALTKSIHKLEDELDAKLFDRGNNMELTPTGQHLLGRARHVVHQATDLEREMSQLKSVRRGELKIGAGPLIAEAFIGLTAARFLTTHPGVRVSMHLGAYYAFAPLLRERKLDFFAADITEIEIDPDLVVRPFPNQAITWFCRAGHPLAGREGVSPAEFFSYPIALPSLPGWAQHWFDRQAPGGKDGFRPAFESNHYPSLKTIVENSDAVSGSIRAALGEDLRAGRIALIGLDAPPLAANAGLVHLKGRSLAPAAQAFIEELDRQIERAGQIDAVPGSRPSRKKTMPGGPRAVSTERSRPRRAS
jgi:DNA-binding transcriptional LysR family regulator